MLDFKVQKHADIIDLKGGSAPSESEDGSAFVKNFALTNSGEPINLLEYSFDIASIPNVHVLFMQDWDPTKNAKVHATHIKDGVNFYEKVLPLRPGQDSVLIF